MKLYGKRGERQHGVDIYDPVHADCWAAQCKLHEAEKTLPPAEVLAEVVKADGFPQPIKHYAVCTTGRRTVTTQDAVLKLNIERRAAGKFSVELIYWDEIEMRLDSDQGFREVYQTSTAASVRSVVREELAPLHAQLNLVQTELSGHADPSAIDAELDRAKHLIDSAELAAGRALLRELKATKFDRLSPLQRFRCLTNLGIIELRLGNDSAAGRLLQQGAQAYPEHEKSPLNLAHAFCILGDGVKAWEFAQQAHAAAPEDGISCAALVAYAPAEVSDEVLLAQISVPTTDPRVALAFANRCLIRQAPDEALRWVDKISNDASCRDDPEFLVAKGRAIAGSFTVDDAPSQERAAHDARKEALELFERASRLSDEAGNHRAASQAQLCHAQVALRLGLSEVAEASVERGIWLSTSSPITQAEFYTLHSELWLGRGNFDRAVESARKAIAFGETPHAHMLLAASLWNRNAGEDRANAQHELKSWLPKLNGAALEQATDNAMTAFIASGSLEDADTAIATAQANGLEAAAAQVQQAKVALARGNTEAAIDLSKRAAKSLTDQSSHSTRRNVAQLLNQFGQFDDAIEVIAPIASRVALSRDTKFLLSRAIKTSRDDVVLEWCKGLWDSGAVTGSLRWTYLNTVERYDPTAALHLIQQRIPQEADPHELCSLRARQVLLQHRLRQEPTKLEPRTLPAIDDEHAYATPMIAEALWVSGHLREATAYAYAMVLRYPDEPASHATLIRCFLRAPKDSNIVDGGDSADIGCTVEYQEATDPPVTITIEQQRVPGLPDVAGVQEPLVQRLIGARSGDSVTLATGSVAARTAIVRSVVPAALHRFQNSLSTWQLRFPDVPFLEQIRLTHDAATGELDVSTMLSVLKARAASVAQLNDFYRSGSLPIEFMAEHNGNSLFSTMEYLASSEELFVNCAWAPPAAFVGTLDRLDAAKGLILDGTALWTMHMLGLADKLSQFPLELGIVHGCLDAVHEAIDTCSDERAQGRLILSGDTLAMVTDSPEARARQAESWTKTASVLSKLGVYGATDLAAMSAARREQFVSYAGKWSAQSVAAAHQHGFVLWADDRVLEFLADHYFQQTRVWTQAVLAWLVRRGTLTAVEYRRATAKLQWLGFAGTRFDPETLVEAARVSDWTVTSRLFIRNLAQVGQAGTNLGLAIAMSLALVRGCMTEVALPLKQTSVISALMEQLALRDRTHRVAREVQRQVPSVLRLHPIAARRAVAMMESWLQTRVTVGA